MRQNKYQNLLEAALLLAKAEECDRWRKWVHEYEQIDGCGFEGHGGDIETCDFCSLYTQRIAELMKGANSK